MSEGAALIVVLGLWTAIWFTASEDDGAQLPRRDRPWHIDGQYGVDYHASGLKGEPIFAAGARRFLIMLVVGIALIFYLVIIFQPIIDEFILL
ncbi:hypothetical protein [Methylobacterium nodulans]|uniref:Uncharacterized protein n=1 Tax=Methylobacterium nodulans (strain LMG 21967 / CNCM I-2342 / ORS 2060) TaxID=460265 RepID=B8IUI0_METNO|nr:hypothetical protein [Methylobacterium nodulans]ACL57048.1 hypothetical protein Mnod_2063 [Methylobacterium nodulans ORS 2060]